MKFTKIIAGILSLFFFMIGLDKFLNFLEPPCSLSEHISPLVWKLIGVLQVAAGILIWSPKYRKYVAGFFFIFMIVFIIVHFTQKTNDVGGATFMAVLLGALVWSPSFLTGKKEV